ncbi:glycine betaine ABC transporter substrate-binding protein [Gracilimonas tropica]|uniref:glycine betaine ABC transporter substrate-binding protein n=1 Tax=Gracilimonas tropica TaxID=454600 RepID=UPI00036D70DC|nr:glycine betaine ABC transporter substrate-binding protein [Gracilimonas tropica]
MKIVRSVSSIVFIITATVLTGLIVYGCNPETQEPEEPTIRMVYANWSEGVAMTHLTAEILESNLGYEVVTKMTDVQSVFKQLQSKEYDVFVDAWLPNTHENYMREYGTDLDDLGVNVSGVQTGFLVPNYISASTISDLSAVTDTIIGIDVGAGIMTSAENAIREYDLNVVLKSGSEANMTNALIGAIKKREPIVVTGWVPHWIYNRFELRFLNDPKNVFGNAEKIHTIARNGFTEDHPRAALFLERFKMSDAQLAALMDEIQAFPTDERRAVRNWMQENEYVVNRWIRDLEPEREKVM